MNYKTTKERNLKILKSSSHEKRCSYEYDHETEEISCFEKMRHLVDTEEGKQERTLDLCEIQQVFGHNALLQGAV